MSDAMVRSEKDFGLSQKVDFLDEIIFKPPSFYQCLIHWFSTVCDIEYDT